MKHQPASSHPCRLTFALMLAMLLSMVLVGATGRAMAADLAKGAAAYEAGDYATAVQERRPLAKAGHAESQFNLGLIYGMRQGVPQDYIAAYMWLNLAASNGITRAIPARFLARRLLSQAEIEQAQARAAQCLASDYQNCGG